MGIGSLGAEGPLWILWDAKKPIDESIRNQFMRIKNTSNGQ